MGTNDTDGSDSWMVRDGLNHYADLTTPDYGSVNFTVVNPVASGSDFHWDMITATYAFQRGAAVPVKMTFSSQHLSSWSNQTWWNNNSGSTILHWISVRGYSGFWDGTYGPDLYVTDSSGGLGGSTGEFTNDSRLVYNLNYANSRRIVY